jgi:hypothetical protein
MDEPKLAPEEGVQDFTADQMYMVLCLVALILTVVGLGDLGDLAIIPFVLGVMAVYFRWTSVPVVWLLVLAIMTAVQSQNSTLRQFGGLRVSAVRARGERGPGSAIQMLTCAAALAFTAGYCRRLVLLGGAFPGDTRNAPPAVSDGRHAALKPARRDNAAGNMAELMPVVLAAPVCCAVGYTLWMFLVQLPPPQPDEMQLSRLHDEWGLLVLCWVVGVAGAVGSVVTGYLERARATPEESLLYLQDQLWRETRREQGRLNRWLVWSRLRGQRRKEKA